jgi:hypothetical protein
VVTRGRAVLASNLLGARCMSEGVELFKARALRLELRAALLNRLLLRMMWKLRMARADEVHRACAQLKKEAAETVARSRAVRLDRRR